MRPLLIGLACAALLVNAAAAATAPPPRGAVTITPPSEAGFSFKPGPGQQETATYCLTCHSAAYVSTQPVLSHDQWQAEVVKMRAVYAAKIPDTIVPTIVDYLTAQYGKP